MPVNPGDGEDYAARVARLLDATEAQLLTLLAQMLREGADRDDWREAKLRDLQRLLWEATKAGRTITPEVMQTIRDVILDAMNAGTATALNDLPRDTPVLTGRNVQRSTTLAASLEQQVRSAIDRMPILLSRAYQEAVHAGAAQVLGGKVTRLQASQSVLDRLLSQGVRGYTDRAGRQWSLDTYVEMAVRSVTGQAAVDAHVDQLAYAGRDLGIVSDAPRECPLCRPWEGKVLSLSGVVGAVIVPSRTTGRPSTVHVAGTLSEARAAGLMHPNCRHSVSSYVPGATRPPNVSHDPDGYEAGQRQRAMERKVREWKRRQALALDDDTAARAASKVRQWQGALREHVDTHDLKRLRSREQIAPLAH